MFPDNWIYKEIKDVLLPLGDGKVLHQGWSPRCEPEPSGTITEWAALKTTAIQDGWFDESFNKRLPTTLSPRPDLEVHPGDILLTCAGPRARCGVVCLVRQTRPRLMISGKMYRFRANESEVTPEFLLAYLRSEEGQAAINKMKTGGNESGLNLTHDRFFQLRVPVAPLSEQRRIVARLDGLFNRSKSARDNLARVPGLVERYKLAILAAVFRGDVTANWRTAHPTVRLNSLIKHAAGITRKRVGGSTAAESSKTFPLPQTWRAAPVESIGKVILGRQRSPENHMGPNMRPYIRAANITWHGWDLSDVKQMNFDERDLNRFRLRLGDVLINEGSGSADEVGKPAIWNGEINNCCFQNTLIAVRPHATTSEYLYFVLLNAALSKAFVDEARGVNIHHIGRAGLAQFVIPVPPSEEQQEIVKRIKSAFEVIDKVVVETSRASQLLNRLDQATLAKAFRGELVGPEQFGETRSSAIGRCS